MLERDDDLRTDHQGIDDQVRCGGVAAASGDVDGEVVLAGHHVAGAGEEMSGRGAGKVVQPVDAVEGEPLQQPVIDHRPGTTTGLLGGLEDGADGAVEASLLGQNSGGPEEHGDVPVVAAGVHGPGVGGRVLHSAFLGDRERIQLRAQPHDPARASASQRADDACATDARDDLEPELGEDCGDIGTGAVLVERGFGYPLKVVSPLAEQGVVCSAGGEDHRTSL